MSQPRPRPQLAWENSQLQQRDDLALAVTALKNSLRITRLAIRVIIAVGWQRISARFARFMRSLIASWAIAGLGWGCTTGLALTLILTR